MVQEYRTPGPHHAALLSCCRMGYSNTAPARTSQLFDGILQRPLRMWLLFWTVAMALYAVAWRGGFVYDFLGWMQFYETHSFGEIVGSDGINNKSLYHATQLQLYVLTKLFGFSPLPWFLVHTALHAVNATLFFRLVQGVGRDLRVAQPAWLAGGAAFLALITPGAQEVVVYKAAYHYLPGVAAIFGILLLARKALLTGHSGPAWWAVGLFALTTFSLEIFYTTPWLVLCLATALFWSGNIDAGAYRRGLLRIFVPMLALFLLHLVLVRATAGTWVSHGAYVASGAITPAGWVGRIYGYEHELLFLGRYHPVPVRQVVIGLDRVPAAGWALGAMLVALGVFMLARFRRASPLFQMWVWLTAGAFISLAIALHYMLDDILLGMNDRMLYYTSFFHCALIALAVYAATRSAPTRRAKTYIASILLIGCVYASTTFYAAWQWYRSTQVIDALATDFPTEHAGPILILNGPVNYKGFPMVISDEDDAWRDQVRLRTGRPVRGVVYDVSSYNMSRWCDGASLEQVGDTTVKVILNQWGTWWWYKTLGALDRDHPLFRLRMIDAGHWYELDLKPGAHDALLLVQEGRRWKRHRLRTHTPN